MDLIHQKCAPCEGGTKPMTSTEMKPYLDSINHQWQVTSNKQIKRKFQLKNFIQALDFINQIGKIAESEGHHPDIHLTNYKSVTIDLTTHAIKGLSVNDFILAAKIDKLAS